MITDTQEKRLLSLGAEYPRHDMQKFCQRPRAWFREADNIARRMGLHECGPIEILDLGCGFGYFLAACSEYGHGCTGLDVPDTLSETAAGELRVHRISHEIKAFEPLPPDLTGYDLITTFGVNFRYGPKAYWGMAEYLILANDVRLLLHPGGKWVLRPNQTDDRTSPIGNLVRADWWQRAAGCNGAVTVALPEVIIQWPTD